MGPLEEELTKATQLSEAELTEKLKVVENSPNVGEAGAVVVRDVVLPLIAAQRDAILRLAREVDELREQG
jgi:hypothetical protein